MSPRTRWPHAGGARRASYAGPPPQQAYAPEPAAPPPPDPIEQLKQLGALHAQGVLTDDEFAREKAKLLG